MSKFLTARFMLLFSLLLAGLFLAARPTQADVDEPIIIDDAIIDIIDSDPITGTGIGSNVPGVNVSPTHVDVTEGGVSGSYAVVLTARPSAPVTVTVQPDEQVTPSATALIFDEANWSIQQVVVVTAVDDWAIEAPLHVGAITHSVASADEDYDGLGASDVAAIITDNDANRTYLPFVSDVEAIITDNDAIKIYLPLVVRNYPPPWWQGTGSQGIRFRTPSGCGDSVWYAGTSGENGVWKSTDSAQTWTKIADLQPDAYPVIANPANCDQAYVAAWGSGVYRLAGASTPTAINNNLGEHYLYGLALTGTALYAGASSQGIYETNVNTINWQPANDGIDDLRIRSLHVAGANLYAGGRDCAIYVSPDGGASWGVHKVLTTDCDDAQVWSVVEAHGTLFAGMGLEKGLYYLDGVIWRQITAIPTKTIYGLAFDDARGYLYVSTYGAGIYRCQVDAGKPTHCLAHNLGLTTLNMREIHIHADLVVVGSDDGLWYRPLLP